ncbi:MAG: hypothetical protein K8I60_10820 [Anaerolineae bacterium]|nr:hypothetical protein [Anaerolineae bacterium]
MRQLILSLQPRDVLVVALRQVTSLLPFFEDIHPASKWPRQWIEAAAKFKPIEYRSHSFRFYENDFSDNGSKGFITAIAFLDSAFRAYYENLETSSKEEAGRAIASIINTKILQYWVINFSESWEVVKQTEQEGAVDEKGFEPVRQYRANPQRQAYERYLWLALADDIETISQ